MAQPSTVRGASLVGTSFVHTSLVEKLRKVAPTDAEVLICGATGTGKELYATYVHQQSARAKASFVPVNCGGLPVELFENELFGHVGGAFTGARSQRDGLIHAAEGGTLFLDEINSLTMACQVKLLRFLQDKEYRRLGETRLRRANVRIIAATNVDLVGAVRVKDFREDLFFRLRVVPIEIPSLSQRPDDIPLLAATFIDRCSEIYKLPAIMLSERAVNRLTSYSWPGNVRELENCIKFLTCLQLDRPIDSDDLPLLRDGERDNSTPTGARVGPLKTLKRDLIDGFERTYLENALRCSGGNIAAAARASGKPRRAFFELMRKHRMTAPNCGAVEGEVAASDKTEFDNHWTDSRVGAEIHHKGMKAGPV